MNPGDTKKQDNLTLAINADSSSDIVISGFREIFNMLGKIRFKK